MSNFMVIEQTIFRIHNRIRPYQPALKLHHYKSNYSDNYFIPAKPLHNHDIVSVHLNNFHCMEICDKLSRHLSMWT